MSGSFQQQGEVAWVDLSKSTVNFSVDILARLAAADVHVYTLCVGQALARSFQLGRGGQRRLDQAISELSCMGTMGNIIHFGFGVDSVVRRLVDLDQGRVLAALCAATVECYPEDQAANIMWELVQLYRELDHFTPSAPQWKSLIRACAGMLTPTTFPKIAEHFMSLEGLTAQPGRFAQKRPDCSSPDTIAQALMGIGQLSTGKLKAISIFGGSDAGWLAAVAEWLFDLRVAISTTTGQQLYTNCKSDDEVQLHIIFREPSTDDRSQQIEVRSKIYYLRSISQILNRRDNWDGISRVCGRVPWESALSSTFGSSFASLMKLERLVGHALGCAARVFEAIVNKEESFDVDYPCDCYFSSSYGKGLVGSMILTFPELRNLRQRMDWGAEKSAEQAIRVYESSLVDIQNICCCSRCKDGWFNWSPGTGAYCLASIVEAILTLSRCLAGVSRAENLYPLLSGLQTWYNHHDLTRKVKSEGNGFRTKRRGNFDFLLEFPFKAALVEANVPHQVNRLADAAKIFGRGQIEPGAYKGVKVMSAISVAGITVHLDILSELSDDPERIGLCHIVPGNIDMHGRAYSFISDLGDWDPTGQDFRKRHGHRDATFVLQSPTILQDNYHEASLAVSHSIDSINVGLYIKDTDGGVTLVPPAEFTLDFLGGFGVVRCSELTCSGANKALPEEVSSSTVAKLDPGGLAELWHFQGGLLARAVAQTRFGLDKNLQVPGCSTLIRTQECIPCCRKAALARKRVRVLIISRREI